MRLVPKAFIKSEFEATYFNISRSELRSESRYVTWFSWLDGEDINSELNIYVPL